MWVWMGDGHGGGANGQARPSSAAFEPPCSPDDLDANAGKFQVYDFTCELPYDHSYLCENLADPAHIPISHDRTPGREARERRSVRDGGGRRQRLRARVARSFPPESKPDDDPASWQDAFRRAGHRALPRHAQEERSSAGVALHAAGKGLAPPLPHLLLQGPATGSARLLLGLKPLWARHLNSCKILEQDVALITSQEDYLSRTGRPFAEEALVTLGSSDAFVLAYRKWLDAVGQGMPWAVGWETATARPPADVPHVSLPGHRSELSRLERHVRLSKASTRALRRARKTKRTARVAAACFVAAAYPLAGAPLSLKVRCIAAAATLGAVAVATAAGAVERAFEQNYVRHSVRSP